MQEQLITFETAKLASEKGYSPILLGEVFRKSLPTQSLLQKWLREVHNIHIDIPYMDEVLIFGYKITTIANNTEVVEIYKYNLYEEALEIGLQEALKLIEIVKNK